MYESITLQLHDKRRLQPWPNLPPSERRESLRRLANQGALRLQALERKQASHDGNKKLSAVGIQEAKHESSKAALGDLSPMLEAIQQNRQEVERDFAKVAEGALSPRDKDDTAGALVDIALAERIREMGARDVGIRLDTNTLPPEATRVIAMLPPLLTGVSESQRQSARQARVRDINPEAADSYAADMQAIDAAEGAIQGAYELAGEGLDLAERREASPAAAKRFDLQTPILDELASAKNAENADKTGGEQDG